MTQKRRQHTGQFKFKVALEAAIGLKTINEIASEHNLHPNQVSSWKQQLLEEGATVFGRHTPCPCAAISDWHLVQILVVGGDDLVWADQAELVREDVPDVGVPRRVGGGLGEPGRGVELRGRARGGGFAGDASD
jgi:transposase-like protein